jgi:hypothetical protein
VVGGISAVVVRQKKRDRRTVFGSTSALLWLQP